MELTRKIITLVQERNVLDLNSSFGEHCITQRIDLRRTCSSPEEGVIIIIADHLMTYEIMRYYFLSLLCVIAFLLQNARTVDAQTIVTTYRESTFEQRNHDIRFSVIDSLTLEPIEFASAYLIPHGDTIITHFTISAKNGEVQFSNVMKGRYRLNVEILGYNSFSREYAINSDDAVPKVIKLSESKGFIDAATITGLADPIRQVKDTIIMPLLLRSATMLCWKNC